MSFAKIPIELKKHILSFLDVPSCIRASMVCKEWKSIADCDDIWRMHVWNEYGLNSAKYRKKRSLNISGRNEKEASKNGHTAAFGHKDGQNQEDYYIWKSVYKSIALSGNTTNGRGMTKPFRPSVFAIPEFGAASPNRNHYGTSHLSTELFERADTLYPGQRAQKGDVLLFWGDGDEYDTHSGSPGSVWWGHGDIVENETQRENESHLCSCTPLERLITSGVTWNTDLSLLSSKWRSVALNHMGKQAPLVSIAEHKVVLTENSNRELFDSCDAVEHNDTDLECGVGCADVVDTGDEVCEMFIGFAIDKRFSDSACSVDISHQGEMGRFGHRTDVTVPCVRIWINDGAQALVRLFHSDDLNEFPHVTTDTHLGAWKYGNHSRSQQAGDRSNEGETGDELGRAGTEKEKEVATVIPTRYVHRPPAGLGDWIGIDWRDTLLTIIVDTNELNWVHTEMVENSDGDGEEVERLCPMLPNGLRRLQFSGDSDQESNNWIIDQLAHLPDLQFLAFDRVQFGYFNLWSNLRKVKLKNCLGALTTLFLHDCDVSRFSLHMIGYLDTLESVTLMGTSPRDDSLDIEEDIGYNEIRENLIAEMNSEAEEWAVQYEEHEHKPVPYYHTDDEANEPYNGSDPLPVKFDLPFSWRRLTKLQLCVLELTNYDGITMSTFYVLGTLPSLKAIDFASESTESVEMSVNSDGDDLDFPLSKDYWPSVVTLCCPALDLSHEKRSAFIAAHPKARCVVLRSSDDIRMTTFGSHRVRIGNSALFFGNATTDAMNQSADPVRPIMNQIDAASNLLEFMKRYLALDHISIDQYDDMPDEVSYNLPPEKGGFRLYFERSVTLNQLPPPGHMSALDTRRVFRGVERDEMEKRRAKYAAMKSKKRKAVRKSLFGNHPDIDINEFPFVNMSLRYEDIGSPPAVSDQYGEWQCVGAIDIVRRGASLIVVGYGSSPDSLFTGITLHSRQILLKEVIEPLINLQNNLGSRSISTSAGSVGSVKDPNVYDMDMAAHSRSIGSELVETIGKLRKATIHAESRISKITTHSFAEWSTEVQSRVRDAIGAGQMFKEASSLIDLVYGLYKDNHNHGDLHLHSGLGTARHTDSLNAEFLLSTVKWCLCWLGTPYGHWAQWNTLEPDSERALATPWILGVTDCIPQLKDDVSWVKRVLDRGHFVSSVWNHPEYSDAITHVFLRTAVNTLLYSEKEKGEEKEKGKGKDKGKGKASGDDDEDVGEHENEHEREHIPDYPLHRLHRGAANYIMDTLFSNTRYMKILFCSVGDRCVCVEKGFDDDGMDTPLIWDRNGESPSVESITQYCSEPSGGMDGETIGSSSTSSGSGEGSGSVPVSEPVSGGGEGSDDNRLNTGHLNQAENELVFNDMHIDASKLKIHCDLYDALISATMNSHCRRVRILGLDTISVLLSREVASIRKHLGSSGGGEGEWKGEGKGKYHKLYMTQSELERVECMIIGMLELGLRDEDTLVRNSALSAMIMCMSVVDAIANSAVLERLVYRLFLECLVDGEGGSGGGGGSEVGKIGCESIMRRLHHHLFKGEAAGPSSSAGVEVEVQDVGKKSKMSKKSKKAKAKVKEKKDISDVDGFLSSVLRFYQTSQKSPSMSHEEASNFFDSTLSILNQYRNSDTNGGGGGDGGSDPREEIEIRRPELSLEEANDWSVECSLCSIDMSDPNMSRRKKRMKKIRSHDSDFSDDEFDSEYDDDDDEYDNVEEEPWGGSCCGDDDDWETDEESGGEGEGSSSKPSKSKGKGVVDIDGKFVEYIQRPWKKSMWGSTSQILGSDSFGSDADSDSDLGSEGDVYGGTMESNAYIMENWTGIQTRDRAGLPSALLIAGVMLWYLWHSIYNTKASTVTLSKVSEGERVPSVFWVLAIETVVAGEKLSIKRVEDEEEEEEREREKGKKIWNFGGSSGRKNKNKGKSKNERNSENEDKKDSQDVTSRKAYFRGLREFMKIMLFHMSADTKEAGGGGSGSGSGSKSEGEGEGGSSESHPTGFDSTPNTDPLTAPPKPNPPTIEPLLTNGELDRVFNYSFTLGLPLQLRRAVLHGVDTLLDDENDDWGEGEDNWDEEDEED